MKIPFIVCMAFLFTLPAMGKVFDDNAVLKQVAHVSVATEISAFMPKENALFTVGDNKLSVFKFFTENKEIVLKLIKSYELQDEAASIAVFEKTVAIAYPGENGSNGRLQFYEYERDSLKLVFEETTCAGLDMVTFSPNGNLLVGACEGSPSNDGKTDAEGLVLIAKRAKEGFSKASIQLLSFTHLDSALCLKKGVRPAGKNGFYKGLEPEYIAITKDSKTAFVSLQENNAIARINLDDFRIEDVFGLSVMDFSKSDIAISSGKNIVFDNYPLFGYRQPDGIAVHTFNGTPFVFTADEGADMDYTFYKDSKTLKERLPDLDLNKFDEKTQKALEKAELSSDICGVKNGKDTCSYIYGTRSFSIFNGLTGAMIFSSNDFLEKKLAAIAPDYFNWNSKKNKVKVNARNGDKGSSPENVVLGEINGKIIAFIGIERMSGVMAFDVSDPKNPHYAGYYMDSKDRGPEGMLFIDAKDSPTKTTLLVVSYEFSSTLVVYAVNFY